MEPSGAYRTAHRILIAALLVHAALFVRIAVLHAPHLSYLGPAGADRVFFYVYTRSVVVDGDLAFDDDLALHPPTSGLKTLNGKQINMRPIGSGLLALPLFALTHLTVLASNWLGCRAFAADGYSTPYVISYIASQMFFALLGIWLLFRATVRYVSPALASWAVVGAWFSTNAVRWTSTDLMMSHAAAQFSIAWCAFESLRLTEKPLCRIRWLRLGISFALVAIVRYQNAVFAPVPFVAAFIALRQALKMRAPGRVLSCLGSGMIGCAVAFFPQMLVWRVVLGAWITNSYSADANKMNFLDPHLIEVFTNPPISGLSVWLPALGLGIFGCFALGFRRRDAIAFAAGLSWLIHLYVISCWGAWATLVERCPFDLNFPICLGFAYLACTVGTRWPKVGLIALSLLVAWNIPLVATAPKPVFPFGWTEGAKTLTGVSKLSRVVADWRTVAGRSAP
jgi:hypothetical protein